MAGGKVGEPANRGLVEISFGEVVVARKGVRDPAYSEEAASDVMRQAFIPIRVDVGVGRGSATVWTCDLTSEYIAINADYRS